MPQLALAGEKLVEQMRALLLNADRHDLDIARVRRDAMSLQSVDPLRANMILGGLAALQFDEQSARKAFARAIQLGVRDQVPHSNFALALRHLGRYSDARKEAELAYELAPSNLQALDDLIEMSVHAGAFRFASRKLEIRDRLNPPSKHPTATFIRSASSLLEEAEVADSDCIQLQEMATELLHERSLHWDRSEYLVQSDEESEWLSVWYYLELPVDGVVELTEAFCNRLAENEHPLKAERILGYLYVSAE